MDIQTLLRRQDDIVRQIASIRSMKKGSVTFQRVGAGNAAAAAVSYPVLTWKELGRTKGLRLKTEQEVAWAQEAVAQHKRYAALCREYERLAEELALVERDAGATAQAEAVKKKAKSRRNKARK